MQAEQFVTEKNILDTQNTGNRRATSELKQLNQHGRAAVLWKSCACSEEASKTKGGLSATGGNKTHIVENEERGREGEEGGRTISQLAFASHDDAAALVLEFVRGIRIVRVARLEAFLALVIAGAFALALARYDSSGAEGSN